MALGLTVGAAGCVGTESGSPGDPPGADDHGYGGSGAAAASGGEGPGAGAAGGNGLHGGSGPTGGTGGGSEPINDGFIGGACTSDPDCAYEGGFCLLEEDGFPGGMCSLDCELYCPDQEDAVTTFCANPSDLGTTAADGLCTIWCDYGRSPTGCRPGYQCHALSRHGEPETVRYVCVPGEDSPFVLSSCHQELLARGLGFSPAVDPEDSPDGHPELVCDVEDPVWVDMVFGGVPYRPGTIEDEPGHEFTACPHAIAMDRMSEVLVDLGVTDLVHWGIYNCRLIAGSTSLSEHGHARALDIAALRVSGTTVYTVLDDWEHDEPDPVTPGGILLRSLAQSLYDETIYNIILTPDYNADHEDHLHCDLTPGEHFLK